ncbi:MAG: hypothetical protein AB1488_08825 [Nitrospirota bacterium]
MLIVFFPLIVLFIVAPAFAEDISLHGFVQGNYSARVTGDRPPESKGGDLVWADERVQLKIDGGIKAFRFFTKTDLIGEHINENADVEFREAYVDYASKSWDMRLGKQMFTWGVGDLIFINDVFPKDYEAFFSGRPMEYLKRGVDAVKVGLYPKVTSIELVAIPFFKSNNYPKTDRFIMYDSMPNVRERSEKEPNPRVKNTEYAVRIYRDILGMDAALYVYRGFHRKPAMMVDNPDSPRYITYFYPRLSVYGFSLQGRMLEGILSLEGGYYDSKEDRAGKNSMVPNSQTRGLVGYNRQLWEDFTIGIQYYGEYMHRYTEYKGSLSTGSPRDKRLKQLATLRLTQFLKYQTIKLSLFTFYSPSDKDYMINPEFKYSLSDHVWFAVGGNVFGGGKPHTEFGQLNKDDNIYTVVRYEF